VKLPLDDRSLQLVWCGLIGLFPSRASLETEILALRHQLNILRRKSSKRPTLGSIDRLMFAGLYGLAPGVLSALAIVRPETVIRWHLLAMEVAAVWWPSEGAFGAKAADPEHQHRQPTLGRPTNPQRAPQAWYRCRADDGCQVYGSGRGPPSQGWKTFLRNHADGVASMDLFVVPTISFRLLYGFLILHHGRREKVWTRSRPRTRSSLTPGLVEGALVRRSGCDHYGQLR
jgi:hypothetical protein